MKIADCDCVILCGGLGTRLRDVIGQTQKVMAQIKGHPFLDRIIEHLKQQGAERIVLCTGYQADAVEDYYREHDFGITIDFSREDEPLGTAGAVNNAREIITSDPFFVFNGDSFLPADLSNLLNAHRHNEAQATVLVSRAQESGDFGSIKMGEDGQIISFKEKDQKAGEAWVNAGVYCLNQTIFEQMCSSGRLMFEDDVFPSLVGKGLFACKTAQSFTDIGTPERYESAREGSEKSS